MAWTLCEKTPAVDAQLEQRPVSRSSSAPTRFSVPKDQDPIIAFCYELVSAGRSLTEILAEAKQLTDIKAGSKAASQDHFIDVRALDGVEAVTPKAGGLGSGTDQTAGLIAEPRAEEASVGSATFGTSSWCTKNLFFAAVLTLALGSSAVYSLFSKPHPSPDDALLQRAQNESHEASQKLLPLLRGVTIADLPKISQQLQQFEAKENRISLLLGPVDEKGSFYFVSSWPAGSADAERQDLISDGIIDRLAEICHSQQTFSLLHHPASGRKTEATAVSPLTTQMGCWAVVTTLSGSDFSATAPMMPAASD